jgi:hypothetical protein
MKKLYFFVAAVIFLAAEANATIRRVGFFANQIANQDYYTFQDAYNAANNNDTILIFPGKSLTSIQLNKKLVIIGTGNWLDPNSTPKGNANLQAFAGTPTAASIGFQTGSAGSTVSGFDFASSTVYVGANNITLRRNANLLVTFGYNPNTGGASITQTVSNLQLLENYRLAVNDYYGGFTFTGVNISNNLMSYISFTTNSTFNGNIANNVWAYDGSNGANGGTTVMSNSSPINLGGGAWLFQNNILLSYSNVSAASNYNYFYIQGETNSVFNYNVNVQSYNGSAWPTGTGNVTITPANATLVFNGFPLISTYSADNRYQLQASSAAKVANRPGSSVDAGIFGGLSPYKLSTIPAIPTIYQFTSPQGNNPSGSTIQFNVSTRGNN